MRRLEHVGIAVSDVEASLRVVHTLFGRRPYKVEYVERERVRTHFVEAGSTKLEFLESTDPESPIGRFLNQRGPGLHHLAFEVDDIDAAYARMVEEGFRVLGEPRPGADGKRIFFVHPKDAGGVLVECCMSEPGPGTPLVGDGPAEAPCCVVSGPDLDRPVAVSLVRRMRVWTVAPGTAGSDVPELHHRLLFGDSDPSVLPGHRTVLVDPSRPVPEASSSDVLIVRRSGATASDPAGRTVVLPAPLLSRLPDPKTVLADLVIAFLTS